MKTIGGYGLLTVVFFIFFCGTYRHDIDKQKYLALAMQPQFDCVGHVYLNGISKGTGELIDKKHLISAAHVFTEKDETRNAEGTSGRSIVAPGKWAIEFKGKKYAVESIVVYPDYLNNAANGDFDIALIELTQEVPDIVPAVINTDTNELHSVVTCVGYGASGPATKFDDYTYGEKIAGENVIDSFSGRKVNGLSLKLTFDFDSPDDSTLNVMGSGIPRPLEYYPNGGDSGGGMFINKNGKWLLAGITARSHITIHLTSGYYGSTVDYIRVSAYAGWITKTIAR